MANPPFEDLPTETQDKLARAGYEVLTMMAEAPNWDGAADWLEAVYETLKPAYPEVHETLSADDQ